MTLRATLRSSPEGSYQELAAIARALGVAWAGGSELTISLNGVETKLWLCINSGTVVGLGVGLTREGPGPFPLVPEVRFRAETAEDRAGKTAGIARELQVGEAGFDAKVYVENDASDESTARLLASPGVRAAVARLVGATTVKVSPAGVSAEWTLSAQVFPAEPVLEHLELLLTVLRAPAPSGQGTLPRGAWLKWLTWPGLFAAPFYAVVVTGQWTASWWLRLLGVVIGLVLVPFAHRAVRALVAGDWSAHHRLTWRTLELTWSFPWLVAGALLHVNGALDRAPSREVRGVVTSVSAQEEDEDTVEVELRWDDGSERSARLLPPVRVGQSVVERRGPGALGFEWHTAAQH